MSDSWHVDGAPDMGIRRGAWRLVVRIYKMWAEYLAQTSSLSINGPCSVIMISISIIIMINGRIRTSQQRGTVAITSSQPEEGVALIL